MWVNFKGTLINLDNVQAIKYKYYSSINQTDLYFIGIERRSFQLKNVGEAISIIDTIKLGIIDDNKLVEIE